MLLTTLTQINTQLEQWSSIDIPHLVAIQNPDTKLADLNFADIGGRYFINLASRVRDQFIEEFSTNLAVCYPSTFTGIHLSSPDSNQNYTILAVIQNFISHASNSQFPQAAQYLKVLVNYQMQNGFWDRSRRKIHHPGSIGVNNMLEQLGAANHQLDETTENFRTQLTSLEERYEAIDAQITNITELHTSGAATEESIRALKTQADQELTEIRALVSSAETDAATVEANRKVIDQFSTKISDREAQLETQKKLTETYEKSLERFTEAKIADDEAHIEYVKETREQIDTLISEATEALELNTAIGLSREFQNKAKSLKPTLGFKLHKSWFPFCSHGNGSGWWLIGSGFFVIGAILIAIALIAGNVDLLGLKLDFQMDAWHQMIGRISVVGLLVTAAVFCAKQFTKARNLYEDYAYRQILTSSLPAFLKQLEEFQDSETMGAQYLQKVLEEVKTHPTREVAEGDLKTSDISLGKDQIDLLKTLVTTFK